MFTDPFLQTLFNSLGQNEVAMATIKGTKAKFPEKVYKKLAFAVLLCLIKQ